MIGTIFTIQNRDGDIVRINDHTTDTTKFIALQSYPQFDLDIKNNEIDREGQHGIWDFYSYYGRRLITFSGIIYGTTESKVEEIKGQLLKVLAFPLQPSSTQDGQILLKWTDIDSQSWQVEAKLFRDIQFNRNIRDKQRLDFSFSLKVSDPFIVSQTLNTQVGIRGYLLTGAQFPIELPAQIGEAEFNILNVLNSGSSFAHTVIRIYGEEQGDVTNPRIRNLTTGKEFLLNTIIQGEDNYIEIDSKVGSVLNQDGDDMSGAIDGSSEFILLKQGMNGLIYLSDEDPLVTLEQPTAEWRVSYRNTKI